MVTELICGVFAYAKVSFFLMTQLICSLGKQITLCLNLSMIYYRKYPLFTLNLDNEINVIRQSVKYPLHHVTKSEVATFNDSEGDPGTGKCRNLSLESRSH